MTAAEHRDQIIRRYQAGDSIRTIGADLGLHYSTVRTLLDRAGIAMRPRGSGQHRVPPAAKQPTEEQIVDRNVADTALEIRAILARIGRRLVKEPTAAEREQLAELRERAARLRRGGDIR